MHQDLTNLFNLEGKVALVTGGARDLGADAARILAAAGCSVAVTSRTLESAEAAADEIRGRYAVEALAIELDQRDPGMVSRAFARLAAWKGRLDILVNNAGGTPTGGPLLERPPSEIADLIALNLTGAIYCCQEAAKLMAPQRAGKIINIASVAALVGRNRKIYESAGMAGQPVDYAAAKAGVVGLTLDLAGYLSPMGICVNAISPGGFARQQPGNFMQDYANLTPLGRMGRSGSDLNGAVLFLASPASDYITGHNLVVDGGFSIWR